MNTSRERKNQGLKNDKKGAKEDNTFYVATFISTSCFTNPMFQCLTNLI